MADIDDEHGFSDDDLDALRSEDFDELQQGAFRATQGPRSSHKLQANSASYGGISFQGQQSSDYGDLDEEVFDAGILDHATLHTPAPFPVPRSLEGGGKEWQQYDRPLPHRLSQQRVQADGRQRLQHQMDHDLLEEESRECEEEEAAAERNKKSREDDINLHVATAVSGARDTQLEKLRREKEELQAQIRAANEIILARSGEVAIVRANQARASKEHDKKVAELERLHSEATARHQVEVLTVKKEKERIATENRFLQQDLTEETSRAKLNQKTARGDILGPGGVAKEPQTPRKSKAAAYPDGFDDDDLILLSPFKHGQKSRFGTPKAGAKRKRKLADSPGKPLRFSQSFGELPDAQTPEAPLSPRATIATITTITTILPIDAEEKHQFLQFVINHRTTHSSKRSIEALAEFTLPSDASRTLSTVLLDQIASQLPSQSAKEYSVAISSAVVSIWRACRESKYYKPLAILMDLVKFILLRSPPGMILFLIDELVPLAQLTADINVIPRYWRFRPLSRPPGDGHTEPSDDVDTNECLEILHLASSMCTKDSDDATRFWKQIRFDFVSMVLRPSQPLADIHTMLRLLHSSILPSTFAMLGPASMTQAAVESHIIDRLTLLLLETPRPAPSASPYSTFDVASLRIQIIILLEALCATKHGASALATHTSAIGRIVRLMSDSLNALYDWDGARELNASLVNDATRLLFYLRTAYPELIDMREKLRVVTGGEVKHTIVLTRLAFSEGLVLEKGIADDVVDCAHQMLDDSITPEEGEAVLAAFAGARR